MKNICRLVASGPIDQWLVGATVLSNLFALTLLLTLPLFAQAQVAGTYSVCPAGPPTCDYTTPEAAVNDPARVNGDIIAITTGTYVLGATLQIDNTMTIEGNDSVLDANGIRAIDVSGSISVSMGSINIRNGQADPGTGGGALRISGGASVFIVGGIFQDNQADFGGAIYNNGSTLQTNVTEFYGNRATNGNGGAVFTDGLGQTSLDQTIIDGNQASNAGGGVAVIGGNLDGQGNGPRSLISLSRSTVSNNAAVTAALDQSNDTLTTTSNFCPTSFPAFYGQTFQPTVEVLTAYEFEVRAGGATPAIGTSIQGRVRVGGENGAIIGTATATWPASIPAFNTGFLRFELDFPVAVTPGATYGIEFDMVPVNDFSVLLTQGDPYPGGNIYSSCAIQPQTNDYDFRTFGGAAGEGGGVHALFDGQANLSNTTVSGNVGDGLFAVNGGIVSTWFNTITNNSGNGTTAIPPANSDPGLVFLTATIVAGNGGNDCEGDTVTSGYNLIGDDTNCVITPLPTDLVGNINAPLDPLLGPLQDNTGRTPTHAIDENSLAFNAAGPVVDGLPCSDFSIDQRNVARPNGPACDIGAFEFAPPVGPLQALINAVPANTLINVPDGTYTESITIGDGKTLRGSNPDSVTIDASNLGVSAITASGDFTLEGIRITGGNSPNNGGGIIANVAGTNINLINVQLDNNSATLDGGAVYLLNGTLNATDTTFVSNNAAGNGGAILGGASSIITISGARFSDNSATSSGGALFNEGMLTISDTTIETSGAEYGGGIFNGAGGSLTIARSTLSNNNASADSTTAGGAIGGAGIIEIRNSTLSGNSASGGNGGGIGLTSGSAQLNNVTLAYNNATAGLGGPLYAEPGEPGAFITFSNTLFAGNSDGGTNCSTVESLGYNLFEITTCPILASDIVSDPLIGLLASNGGPTDTHALLIASPAINAGHPVPNFTQFDAASFNQLQTQGFTDLDAGSLFLAGGAFNVGSAFVTNPIDPGQDFSARFQFRIVPDVSGGGDGITFTISDDPTALGHNGGFLGIGAPHPTEPFPAVIGIVNGVSVEFDTWVNGQAEGANDPDGNHIGIDINGSLSSVALARVAPASLSDGSIWTAWIDYDSVSATLEVSASNNGIRPAQPTVSAVVNIESLTGPVAYVGFTGATGSVGISGEQRILNFSFANSCEPSDQRGEPRPQGGNCDIGAYEGAPIPLTLGQVSLNAVSDLESNDSYPGVTDVPIINIPIEKLTGDVNNAPESAPLDTFPLGSFPIGSFDLRSAPIGSFPLGSFPIGSFPIGSFPLGSFPIGSFPLSSIPLLREGGWSRILDDIPELEGAPLQTVTLEQVLTSSSVPASVDEIELRDLAIEGSPLASLSLQGLSLGGTTVEQIDQWASNAGSATDVCTELANNEAAFTDCAADDTLLSLEFKGAPVSALSLQSLPLGSFSTTAAPLGSFPIGSFPLGSFPLGSFPIGSFPIGSFPLGSFPLGSFPIGSFPLGSFNVDGQPFCDVYDEQAGVDGAKTCGELLTSPTTASLPDLIAALAADGASDIASTPLGSFPLGSFPLGSFPIGSFPLGSFPIGSFPIGSFPIGSFPIGSFPLGSFPIGSFPLGSFNVDGQPFCDVYDRQAGFDGADTCGELLADPATASLADLIAALVANGASDISSTPLGSFPIGSFPIGSFPIGSFPLGSFDLNAPPLSDLSLGDFGGCELIASSSTDDCSGLGLSDSSTLLQVAEEYGSIEASPLGSFPLGSFGISDLPMGSFPIGSFEINGTPLGSFPLGSFDLIGSPIGSFPIGSFPLGSFPLGSFPLGSFDFGAFPIGSFPLGSFNVDGQPFCDVYDQKAAAIDGAETCGDLFADPASATLPELIVALGASGATDIASTPLGSFPLGSFPLGSFPIGSFPADIVTDGPCEPCETLADAARAGVINPSATLADLEKSTAFADVTLAEVMDAMTMATLYGDGILKDIDDLGSLTLGQLLIAMMLKTDFPWETIPLDKLDPQTFSADNFVEYTVDIPLTGTEMEPLSVAVTLNDGFLYIKGSASLDVETASTVTPKARLADPLIVDNGDGTQTLNFNLVLGGFSNNTLSFKTVPPLTLGEYPATAMVTLGTDEPVAADASNGMLNVIPDPVSDVSVPGDATTTPVNVLTLGYISAPDDNDYYLVAPPAAGDRVAVFMSNPSGDNDLIMYEPLSTVEAKGQNAESAPLDSVPFEDDGAASVGNVSEEPNALEDVNLSGAPLASISTNRGTLDESVSAIAGDTAPFTIQVSGYNGAVSVSNEPYTLRVKVTPQVPSPQCTARDWPTDLVSVIPTAGSWTENTNAVFLINYARLAASEPEPIDADEPTKVERADFALTAINNLVTAPSSITGIIDGVVIDVSTITGLDGINAYGDAVDYGPWDLNPCDVDAANSVVNAITRYLEYKRESSPRLTYVTIVGSDEVIPFARKPDETSIANESTFAGEFSDNALYGSLVTRHFLSDDAYGDIDPIPWLDRYLNVPELGVGRLVESAADIQLAAENYLAFGGVLDPQTALSAGYDFVEDAARDIDATFRDYSSVLGYFVEDALIDEPGIDETLAWDRDRFLGAVGINPILAGDPSVPVDLVSFNMHFDFDEALPSSGDASGDYSSNLISTADLVGSDLTRGVWFTVGCHSGTNVPDVSVVAAAPGEEAFTEDWAQAFSRLGALYVAQNAFGLGDTEALALTERLMAIFARNLDGNLTIGQAHAFAKQQYFADLGLYGEYDYKAMQAATLFGLPMYRYRNTAPETDPPEPLPVTIDPISGLSSASWTNPDTKIQLPAEKTSKGDLFSVEGKRDVQFVHFRPLQPIVRRDVTSPDGAVASGAFLTQLSTQDIEVDNIAFARPVIDLGENEPEIETDEVVFPTAFTNIANFKAPPPGGGPFERRDQLNVIVGQFTSPLDGKTSGTERLFRQFDAQVFYRPVTSTLAAASTAVADFKRPEFDNVQASIVGSGTPQAAFSVDVSDAGTVVRVAVLYLQSVEAGIGNWVLVDLVKGGGSNTWTGGGPVDPSALANEKIDYMVQAVDDNGNVANSTFKGEFYFAETIPGAPNGDDPEDPFAVILINPETGLELDSNDWNAVESIQVEVVTGDEVTYEYSVDGSRPLLPLTPAGFIVNGDGVHIIQLYGSDGSQESFVLLIDNTPANIVISRPANGEYVVQGLAPAAEYVCWDSGSGAADCNGPVPVGVPAPNGLPGTQTFLVNATDNTGLESAETNSYFVVQQLSVEGPAEPLPIGSTIGITATATDLADMDEFMTIEWGDGTVSTSTSSAPDTVVQDGDLFTAEHMYATPGVYTVTVTVDYDGGAHVQTAIFEYVVLYDPQGGFVTGGGWFNSPSGAYTPNDDSDEDVTGKAHFGFNSKYKKGQSIPTGSTTVSFAAGGLEFESTVYEWMIITGARARYKGEGTIEGMPGLYKFQVTALDADIAGEGFSEDGFRIKIWQEGSGVLYDNGLGADDTTGNGGTTPIGGGQIKIHEVKKK